MEPSTKMLVILLVISLLLLYIAHGIYILNSPGWTSLKEKHTGTIKLIWYALFWPWAVVNDYCQTCELRQDCIKDELKKLNKH